LTFAAAFRRRRPEAAARSAELQLAVPPSSIRRISDTVLMVLKHFPKNARHPVRFDPRESPVASQGHFPCFTLQPVFFIINKHLLIVITKSHVWKGAVKKDGQTGDMTTSCFPSARQERAFTLIELLVVIAIIAILAAMLLPALSKAKNKAQQTIDLGNHKQILYAATMYAGDNREVLPNSGWGLAANSWAYAGQIRAANGNPAGFDRILDRQLDFFRRGQLYPYLKTEKVLMCPADRVDALFYQRRLYFTSYVWNGAVNEYRNAPAHKITQFKPLSVLQWEADETIPFFFNDSSSYPDEGISERHGKGATIGLISGSTERIAVQDYYGNQFAGRRDSRGRTIPKAMLPNRSWVNPADRWGLP
jgi:prepilin-type N-terminal cleavage/methylation domain-containing protein